MDPPWLRFLTSRIIAKLVPGPKYTLGPRFNDAEILHGDKRRTCDLLVPPLDDSWQRGPNLVMILDSRTPGPSPQF